MAGNSFAETIRSGKPQIGAWMHIPHVIVAETLAQTKLDFLLVDGEHAPIPPNGLLDILPATERYGMPVLYRVSWNRIELIKAALDHGANGIMVPMVNSGAEAVEAVTSAKYPPAGKRGSGAWRASNYYQRDTEYRRDANSSLAVVLQIETREALNNLDDISSTRGVDALFIGPADLALSFGMEPGRLTPELLDACRAVAAAAKKHNIASGIDVASIDDIRRLRELGLSLFTYGADSSFVLDGGRAVAKDFHDAFITK
ncbi:aldolase/citrate lyase family protein [Mesorhizobium sp. VK4C]|uniref:HpcH/HpaI aldolase family protein n=1 Tax=Mesorhizobium captivum TaxID=3072319 RepID=UPI002A248426|nr:aldolase/citrate lyase family protein [Mesorhizobium sp. VK4C]MDX8503116.1 aldolase/citrate lyase family protein [Mesorhizobium sp. VK4C]